MRCNQYFPSIARGASFGRCPGLTAASIHGVPGKYVLPGGKRGKLCAAGFPAPSTPPASGQGTVQTMVLPAGNGGPVLCHSIWGPSLEGGRRAAVLYPLSPYPTICSSGLFIAIIFLKFKRKKQSKLVRNNVKGWDNLYLEVSFGKKIFLPPLALWPYVFHQNLKRRKLEHTLSALGALRESLFKPSMPS